MTVLPLPARLDLTEARPLALALQERVGGPLRLDASEVEHLGALCLQLLIAASQRWRADDHEFEITPRSDAFTEALISFGLSQPALEMEAV